MAVYAFGGILREKTRLQDFDSIFLYKMTPEQQALWDRFRKNFSNSFLDEERRNPIRELMPYFESFLKQEVPLREAVKDERFSRFLKEKGVVPEWAGCFSWTEVLYNPMMGIFVPRIETVICRMLVKKVKGLQVFVHEYQGFIEGKAPIAAKNYELAWSPEKPNVEENLGGRTLQQKTDYLFRELSHFLTDGIPELKKKYFEAKESVVQANLEAKVKLDLKILDERHVEIKCTGSESYEELLEKCEIARIEMRRYGEEATVLRQLAHVLKHWPAVRNNPYFADHPAEDYIALWVIEGVVKREVKEKEVREILSALKLPESKVIAVRRYGTRTVYELPKNEEDRKRLLKLVELERTRAKFIKAVMKVMRIYDRRAYAHLELTDEGKPKWLEIVAYRQVGEDNEVERQAAIRELESRGFKVTDHTWQVVGEKVARLRGTESVQELQAIVRDFLNRGKK